MKIIPLDTFKDNVLNVTFSVRDTDEPVLITSQKGNTVMLSEEDWKSIEDDYLYSKYLEWWKFY